jgi:hypothetical protein
MEEIIEIYNFKIHNYGITAPAGGIPFGDLEKSNGINGTVRVWDPNPVTFNTNDPELANNQLLLSQDPLNSLTTRTLNNKYYKLYRNENPKHQRTNQNYKFDLATFTTLLNSSISIYKNNLINYIPSINVNMPPNNTIIDQTDPNNEGYIRKVNITNNDKIIIMGDFHGSFHTFFRIMLRLHIYGVLNIETYTINNNYKLIFLGDIVDRGKFSLEILEILFRFIHNDTNNDKIIINRGNHEGDRNISERDGLVQEITQTNGEIYYPWNRWGRTGPIGPNTKLLFDNIFIFFRLCPSAIILHNINTNTNYWLCHGFISERNDDDLLIQQFIVSNNNVLRISNIDEIMWNDPQYDNTKIIFDTTGNARGTRNIGLERINQFRNNTGIHFIIRGHNDTYSNASLLCNTITTSSCQYPKLKNSRFFELGNKDLFQAHPHFFNNNLSNKLSSPNQYIDGSVENIFMNSNWTIDNGRCPYQNIKVYPILTISTNTDQDRFLTSDSFIVLHTTLNRNDSILKITPTDINDYLNTNDKDSLLNTIINKPFLLEQSELKNDTNFLLRAISVNPEVLKYSNLKIDKKFLSQAIIINREILNYVDQSLKSELEEQFRNKYKKYKLKYLNLKK